MVHMGIDELMAFSLGCSVSRKSKGGRSSTQKNEGISLSIKD